LAPTEVSGVAGLPGLYPPTLGWLYEARAGARSGWWCGCTRAPGSLPWARERPTWARETSTRGRKRLPRAREGSTRGPQTPTLPRMSCSLPFAASFWFGIATRSGRQVKWDAVVATDLTGGFLVAREVYLQCMEAHGGARRAGTDCLQARRRRSRLPRSVAIARRIR
jgi:hypothetical protein